MFFWDLHLWEGFDPKARGGGDLGGSRWEWVVGKIIINMVKVISSNYVSTMNGSLSPGSYMLKESTTLERAENVLLLIIYTLMPQ